MDPVKPVRHQGPRRLPTWALVLLRAAMCAQQAGGGGGLRTAYCAGAACGVQAAGGEAQPWLLPAAQWWGPGTL